MTRFEPHYDNHSHHDYDIMNKDPEPWAWIDRGIERTWLQLQKTTDPEKKAHLERELEKYKARLEEYRLTHTGEANPESGNR